MVRDAHNLAACAHQAHGSHASPALFYAQNAAWGAPPSPVLSSWHVRTQPAARTLQAFDGDSLGFRFEVGRQRPVLGQQQAGVGGLTIQFLQGNTLARSITCKSPSSTTMHAQPCTHTSMDSMHDRTLALVTWCSASVS